MAALPGAEGAVLEATKELMLASMTEAIAEEAAENDDAKKARNLKARVVKIKAEILSEAIAREAAMHDKDETLALSAALKALKAGDTEQATAVLQDRLAQVRARRRRALMAKRGDSSSSDEEDEGEGETGQQRQGQAKGKEGAQARLAGVLGAGMSAADWGALVAGALSTDLASSPAAAAAAMTAAADKVDPEFARQRTANLQAQLDRGAYLLATPTVGAPQLSAAIAYGLQQLRAAGVGPFFIWMYDEPWRLLQAYWPQAEALLGGPCVLEPTFAAYHLNPEQAKRVKNNQYVGTNFGLPHRDYTFR